MATNYDGNDTFPTSIQIPSNRDKLDVESVNPAFRALADRSRYLSNKVSDLGSDTTALINAVNKLQSGISRVEEVSGLTQLINYPAENAQIVYAENLGLFRFKSGSTLVANNVSVVDSTTASGRWIAIDYHQRGVTVRGIRSLTFTSFADSVSSDWTTADSNCELELGPLEAGDTVDVLLSTHIALIGGAMEGELRICSIKDGGAAAPILSSLTSVFGSSQRRAFQTVFNVSNPGDYKVSFQYRVLSPDGTKKIQINRPGEFGLFKAVTYADY